MSDIPTKRFRVLSIDGGGIRGLYSATVLYTLMRRYRPGANAPDADIGASFDLIVGTSTGGILATALANGTPLSEVISIYTKQGCKIFDDAMPESGLAKYMWLFRNRRKPSAKAAVLRTELEKVFKQRTVGEMYAKRKIALCIPAVNMANHRAWVFKTAHFPEKHRDDKYKLVDMCMATAAAPIFMPMVDLKNPDIKGNHDVFVDGGLWANNPVLIALVEALLLAPDDHEIEIISLGTCAPPAGQVIQPNKTGIGLLDWDVGVKIVEASLDSQASGYQYTAKFLVEYLRKKANRKCTLIRLPQTPPSAEHIAHLGLDKAHPEAITALSQLGKADGEQAHGWSLPAASEEQEILKRIFTSMK